MITGIGSLPHLDPADATAFTLQACPELPAAPSLPRCSPLEGMIAQAAWGMTGVIVTPDGELRLEGPLDPGQPFADGLAAAPAGRPFRALNEFLATAAVAAQPRIKLQLTGPVTLGLALIKAGAPTAEAFQAAGAAVGTRAAALLQRARLQLPAAALVVFLDEPGFVGVGEPAFPIGVEAAVDLLSSALATLEHAAMTGVHCCGRADWNALLHAGPDVLSLPVEQAGTLNAVDAVQLLDRGGWIAWGAVPTDRPLAATATRYRRALDSCWQRLAEDGVDRGLLERQAIITPACGLASHSIQQAERIFELCTQLTNP